MCGINGVFSYSGLSNEQLVREMNAAINHRGPDNSNVEACKGLALGHVRLSIIDLSEHANQPFCDEGYVLVYNGEIYNFEELRSKYGFECSTSSDTEVLFQGLKHIGKDFIKELNGMFAFAFLNRNTNEVLIARDRLGIKPLYIFEKEGTIAFSSELKGLKSIKEELKGFTVNHSAINSFLHLGYIPKPLTIYNEIKKFEPGCIGEIKDGVIKTEKYWSPESQITNEVLSDEKEAKATLNNLLRSSINYRLKSDVPFGTFLSGGIDSSAVSAIAQDVSAQKIKTFSIGFNNPKFNEAEFARQVATHIDSDHHEFMVTENDAKELVGDIIKYYDEPFGDSSSIPTMLVSKLARKEVTMTLSGDGGDELFHGYGFYNWANRLSNPLVKAGKSVIGKVLSLGDNRMKRASNLFSYPKNQLKSHIFSQEQYYFTQKEIDKLLITNDGYPSFIDKEEDLIRSLSPKEKQSLFDINYYLRDDLLTKVDIASMRYSLETRVPILDHRIVEFALNLDEGLKIKNGDQKYLLKQVLYDYVPKEIFDRPKRGFSIPLQKWLETDLKFLIDNNLNKTTIESAGLVNYSEVKRLLTRFKAGEGYLFTRVWALVILHEWFRNN
ncbi:MAG: asparagine synthase (glutamine-hydrolyzing) [Flavobacteriales bacterium]|nr:asparagine synthase (glutamine-hydrolyzing) [Flavobacteriales bacterium]